MSAFTKLSSSIEKKEGYSKEQSDATAAKIGMRKYGKHVMAIRSARARRQNQGKK